MIPKEAALWHSWQTRQASADSLTKTRLSIFVRQNQASISAPGTNTRSSESAAPHQQLLILAVPARSARAGAVPPQQALHREQSGSAGSGRAGRGRASPSRSARTEFPFLRVITNLTSPTASTV